MDSKFRTVDYFFLDDPIAPVVGHGNVGPSCHREGQVGELPDNDVERLDRHVEPFDRDLDVDVGPVAGGGRDASLVARHADVELVAVDRGVEHRARVGQGDGELERVPEVGDEVVAGRGQAGVGRVVDACRAHSARVGH